MAEVAIAHSAPFTAFDLLEMPDDGQRYEVLDGALIMSPAPTPRHQQVADRLRDVLRAAAPPGLEVLGATGLRLRDDDTGFIPDVVVTDVDPVTAGPLLEAWEVLAVVEVVSPSSRRHDRVTKPEVYAEAGVPCLWRVELEPFRGQGVAELPVVLVHSLVNGGYPEVGRLSAGSCGTADVPYLVSLDPADLLRRR